MDRKTAGLSLVALIAGILSAMLGIGGGFIIIPTLIIFFHYKIREAIVLSLGTVIFTVIIGASLNYFFNGEFINWYIISLVILGSIPGVFIGEFLTRKLNHNYLVLIFSLVLFFMGLQIVGLFNLSQIGGFNLNSTLWPLLLIGSFTGFMSGFLGISGGVVLVPALTSLIGIPVTQAIPLSLMATIPIIGMSLYKHARNVKIDYKELKTMVVAAIFGSIFGVILSFYLNGPAISLIFSFILIIYSVRLAYQSIRELLRLGAN